MRLLNIVKLIVASVILMFIFALVELCILINMAVLLPMSVYNYIFHAEKLWDDKVEALHLLTEQERLSKRCQDDALWTKQFEASYGEKVLGDL
jgi:hypothetical protein